MKEVHEQGFDESHCVYLARNEALKREPSLGPEVLGGLFFLKDTHLNPKRVVRAYKSAAEVLGVEFWRGSTVQAIDFESGLHSLKIESVISSDKNRQQDAILTITHLKAKQIVIATGAQT